MDEAVKEASVVHGEEIVHPNSVADRRDGPGFAWEIHKGNGSFNRNVMEHKYIV